MDDEVEIDGNFIFSKISSSLLFSSLDADESSSGRPTEPRKSFASSLPFLPLSVSLRWGGSTADP